MERAIEFILNGERRTVSSVAPTTTALDWLRTAEFARGTKEGCAEGDCGACTIVLGEADGGRMRYRAVNSCLVMLGQLAGKHVLTVEGLVDADGTPHAVQEALVETDGSQCGFCTPGFVMSMFAFFHSGEDTDDESTIHDMLAGNLCRCTGYRPIVDAVKRAAKADGDRFAADESGMLESLGALPGTTGEVYEYASQAFHAPRTLNELLALRAEHPDAYILAGGTDLGLLVSKERRKLKTVIHVTGVDELRYARRTPSHLEIGAAATYADALGEIEALYPSMAAMIRRIGSRQIRNLGTVCGNVGNASPIGDMPPCLIALDAMVVLNSADGGRREIAVEDFFLDYRKTDLRAGEIIEAVRIPHMADHQTFHVYKVSKRFDQDISAVLGAYRLGLDDGRVADVRVAHGGMAATPKRAPACEAALTGKPWTVETAQAGADALARDYAPISDFRASAGYRATVAANLIRRLHLQTTAPAMVSEVMAL
jgi:xanthine dehydrogenase small subunit